MFIGLRLFRGTRLQGLQVGLQPRGFPPNAVRIHFVTGMLGNPCENVKVVRRGAESIPIAFRAALTGGPAIGMVCPMKTVHAVFEKGIFRPLEAVELPERCEVEFEPRPVDSPRETGENLSAIYTILSERYESGERDVAARHNEHQP